MPAVQCVSLHNSTRLYYYQFNPLIRVMICARDACTNTRFGFFPPASLLASPSSQSLCLPSRHANMLRFFPACRRHCWRRTPRKALVFRQVTPTCSGFFRPAGNLCRPRTTITERALAVMADSFFPNIRKEALLREPLPLSLIFLWKSMIRTGGP